MLFAMMLLCGAVLDGIMLIANSVLAAPLNSLPQIRQQTPAAGTGTFTISNRLLKVYNISTEFGPEFRISNISCLCHNFIQL